jgi:predicted ribosomally synthesized peptide with SipW-like signal peptide
MQINKKVVASTAAVLGIAALVAGGTIAYFTDKDTATNTFTVGNVDIELEEKDFTGTPINPEKAGKLMPGSSTTAGVAKNATVTVKEGSSDSYVWVELLVPAPLYESKSEQNESNNALHFNQFLDYLSDYNGRLSGNPNANIMRNNGYTPDWQWSTMKYIGQETIGNTEYARLRTTHKDKVSAGVTTSPAISQFYMDDDVYFDHATNKYMIPADGDAATTTSWTPYDGDWKVIVNAYAIQAAGLADQNGDKSVTVEDAVLSYTDRN